uniref:Uncharacterized protein n=1 Tax=Arundo donax TaxID=35708 RepID=A0A0A9HAW7_ARUDO
MQKLMIVAAF